MGRFAVAGVGESEIRAMTPFSSEEAERIVR